MTLVLRERCVIPARVKSYIYMSVTVKILERKKLVNILMSESKVKENVRTITIQQ